MRKFRLALLLYVAFDFLIAGTAGGFFVLTPLAAAQNKPQYPFVSGAPDCILVPPAPFTAVADSAVYDNRNQGCTTWHLVYNSQGFSALNISFKSADDSGNGPGAFANWGTSGGTLASGTTLPLTATTSGQATGYKYRPFVKISVTSLTGTGTLWPILYGYRPGLSDSNTTGVQAVQGPDATGATSTANPVAIGCQYTNAPPTVSAGQTTPFRCNPNGVLSITSGAADADTLSNSSAGFTVGSNGTNNSPTVYLHVFDGSVWPRSFVCTKTTKLNALAAATTQVVALASGQKIRVCSMTVSNNNATATTLKMVEGTGASCGTGTADLTSLWNIGATTTTPFQVIWGPGGAVTTATAGDALCFTSSAASSLEITITYSQF